VGHTAVMQFEGDLRQAEFIIHQQLLYFFNFMGEVKFFDGDPFHFGKEMRQVGEFWLVLRSGNRNGTDLFIPCVYQLNDEALIFHQMLF